MLQHSDSPSGSAYPDDPPDDHNPSIEVVPDRPITFTRRSTTGEASLNVSVEAEGRLLWKTSADESGAPVQTLESADWGLPVECMAATFRLSLPGMVTRGIAFPSIDGLTAEQDAEANRLLLELDTLCATHAIDFKSVLLGDYLTEECLKIATGASPAPTPKTVIPPLPSPKDMGQLPTPHG
jgi:hypothetical protein